MHTVIRIDPAIMTRFIELKNEQTGTIDLCFDDSDVASNNDFGFMQEGKSYDCKIVLFGERVRHKIQSNAVCRVIDPTVQIGKTMLTKVMIGQDVYYIMNKDLGGEEPQEFYYHFTRKDLKVVNGIVHDDLLDM